MAIFHLTTKNISRGKGQSAIAAAAYRSGDRLRDEQANEQKFYVARAERIVFTDIMAPKDAPEWAHERNALWNEAERAEKRKDSRLARELEIALPHELTDRQRQGLVKDFAREQFVRKGYVVDIAIHAPDKGSDDRNHHAHLLVTLRTLGQNGFAVKKDPTMNRREQLGEWREQWAHLANRHLERHGHNARIDHRSLKEQGVDREPGVHLGYAANEMAQRGAQSDRMDELRGIVERNEIRLDLKQIKAELKTLEKDQAEQQKRDARAQAAAARQAAERAMAQAPAQTTKPDLEIQIAHAAAEADRRAKEAQPRPEAQTKPPEEKTAQAPLAAREKPVVTAKSAAKQGLRVVDKATGVVSSLGDFMLNVFAGPSPQPQENPQSQRFTMDPAERAKQQKARVAGIEAAHRDEKAIESIAEDLKRGRDLSPADIFHLTREHQEQIRAHGDRGVQMLVDDAQKLLDGRKGEERERER